MPITVREVHGDTVVVVTTLCTIFIHFVVFPFYLKNFFYFEQSKHYKCCKCTSVVFFLYILTLSHLELLTFLLFICFCFLCMFFWLTSKLSLLLYFLCWSIAFDFIIVSNLFVAKKLTKYNIAKHCFWDQERRTVRRWGWGVRDRIERGRNEEK